MRVDFKCAECEEVKNISFPVEEGPPKEVLCEKGHQMKRVMKKQAVHVPDYFGEHDFNAMVSHMKNAPRPSGKAKLVY